VPAVHRIGRRPDAWEYPDWSRANPDGTFGNRFDDPDGEYRVLYASSARLGCFLETLARYRPDLTLFAELQEIEGEDDFVPAGVVPREWFAVRVMGSAEAHGRFADIGASDWISTLRRRLASLLIQLGIPDFDASVLHSSGPRRLTQNVSQFVYRQGFNGIRYLSKYGHDIENWALFEPADLTSANAEQIRTDDTDLIAALRLLDLVVD
jgi:RES domain